ncbi:SCO family protein [Stakelama sp. CBK3Z-3]|uniref:SCO family protein n=1 Tax=Stakelama flava TaxID=2860338 RepID=A0ABS6XKK0_9SPHN|nr:SCO family protein [Stakelama flava]MBW4330737.1 SCO family protein [Stakelama flava]
MNRRHFALMSVTLPTAFALAACGAPQPTKSPLAGSSIGGPFSLINQKGERVTERDFAGKYRIMYFGYTYCPDVCPVDMQNIGAGMARLRQSDPDLAKRVVPIFVSVDPERDTPAVVGKFVSAFGTGIIGLTGDPAQIAKVAKEYAVFYKKVQPDGADGYLINHSRAAYLMGPGGDPIALVPADESPQAVADTLRKWVT